MKNLLIYINPIDKKFSKEHEELTKIQIENSLRTGWKKSDIILITNFDWEFKGVKSFVVSDYSVFDQNRSTKIPAILELFKKGEIENDIYWFHDHDAFQLVPFSVDLKKEAGFTTHGSFNPKLWNAGSFFFKKSSERIFKDIWQLMNERGTNEQNALTYMWENNFNNINDKYELMNQTYNIGIYKIAENVQQSELPIKVLHFHPHKKHHLDLFRGMLPIGLVNIFNQYGII